MKLALILFTVSLAGCPRGGSPPSSDTRQKLAEGAYTADLLKCVEAYPAGDPRVDICADGVRANWHRKDGGQ